jgi:FKBP-type peptidyl-prolyl cis-trans isomerase FkpA
MRAILFLFIGAALLSMLACSTVTNCNPVTTKAAAAEVVTLEKYLSDNGIIATKDDRGFYYKIVNAGAGAKPTICNSVSVAYTGSLIDGTQFDASTNATFQVAKVVVGWQEGIPLIAKGGQIKLYIPPSLAYGDKAQGAIPANSILIFDVELKDIL